jgi:uncharacterized membrane protein (DUF2068 family)
MRIHPRGWNDELWICSLRGHTTPAAEVRSLRPGDDDHLGVEIGSRRLSRCLRCDSWIASALPSTTQAETLPPDEHLPKPRRGQPLEEAITMKVIALWRAVHAVFFALVAVLLAVILTNLAGWRDNAEQLIGKIEPSLTETGRAGGADFLLKNLQRLAGLETATLLKLLAVVVVFAVLEGVEAIGLWKERRWAEYLTVIATALLLPYEVIEITKKVTALRIGGFIANVAVVVFLIYTKRLFGLRGGPQHDSGTNWTAVLEHTPPTGRAIS